jgi:hypothetical protein
MEAKGSQPNSNPRIAEAITNKKPDHRRGVIRAQTQFTKDIREMMEGHVKRNLFHCNVALRNQKIKLLKAKLKLQKLLRLKELEEQEEQRQRQEAMAAQQAQQKPVKKDLFS